MIYKTQEHGHLAFLTLKELEDRLAYACDPENPSREMQGVLLSASSPTPPIASSLQRGQQWRYEFAAGTTALNRERARPLSKETIIWAASWTKLITSIAALQLVERGQLHIDESVESILPEVGQLEVLEGWNEDGSPKLRRKTNSITLRMLLSHTSGMGYTFIESDLQKWWGWKGVDPIACEGDIVKAYSTPLTFEPGTSWAYAPGLDWVGLLVERLSGMRLAKYFELNIFGPLGVKDWGFRKSELGTTGGLGDVEERWLHMAKRIEDKGTIQLAESRRTAGWVVEPEVDLGGSGLLITSDGYGKVLSSLCDNDGNLLKPSTVSDYCFKPALDESQGAAMERSLATVPNSRILTGGHPVPVITDGELTGEFEFSSGAVGSLCRKRGQNEPWTLYCRGLSNNLWWVDNNGWGMWTTQLLPAWDEYALDFSLDWWKTAASVLRDKETDRERKIEVMESGSKPQDVKCTKNASRWHFWYLPLILRRLSRYIS